jgi:hypothetical protein
MSDSLMPPAAGETTVGQRPHGRDSRASNAAAGGCRTSLHEASKKEAGDAPEWR